MDSSIEDAMRFISAELQANPNADRLRLIEEACQRFDLNAMQGEFLTSKFVTGS